MNNQPAQPFQYIDIFHDPNWRAKAKALVDQERAHAQAVVLEAARLLDDGMVEEADAKRLLDANSAYFYWLGCFKGINHILENTYHTYDDTNITYEEWEQWELERYGPAGKAPPKDAPAPVRKQHEAFLRMLANREGGDTR